MKKALLLLLSTTLSLAPLALGADTFGRYEAGTKLEEPPAHAPANASRMFTKIVARDEASSFELPATGDGGMIIWTVPMADPGKPAPAAEAQVSTRLRTPSGIVLDTNDRGSDARGVRRFRLDSAQTKDFEGIVPGGAHEVLHVAQTEAAPYSLDIVNVPDNVAAVRVIAAEPDSRLVLSTWASPLSRQPDEPVTLHAELRNGDVAVEGADVTVRFAGPSTQGFTTAKLEPRGNGVYEVTIPAGFATAAGTWDVQFEAEGTLANGARFARTGSAQFFSERGAAKLSNLRTEIVGDRLRVTIDATMYIGGNYRLDVLVADHDRNAIVWGEGARALPIGPATLMMELPLDAAREGLFVDARLLGLDLPAVAGRITN
ncbi:MAG TPA: FixH family protein [Thermoanaerobaculia bacterium]|nr:FixH family protein [Thermoanaerobaculia bacterium]